MGAPASAATVGARSARLTWCSDAPARLLMPGARTMRARAALGAVEEEAVGELHVLAQRLAVIRRDGDDRLLFSAPFAAIPVEETSDLGIHRGRPRRRTDGRGAVSGKAPAGRTWACASQRMRPGEERPAVGLGQPRERPVDDLRARDVPPRGHRAREGIARDLVVRTSRSRGRALEAVVEDVRTGRRRRCTVAGQSRGAWRASRGKPESSRRRCCAARGGGRSPERIDRVRRKRQRNGRDRRIEPDAGAGQPVEIRRLPLRSYPYAPRWSARTSVDRDEEQIRRRGPGPAAAGAEQQGTAASAAIQRGWRAE